MSNEKPTSTPSAAVEQPRLNSGQGQKDEGVLFTRQSPVLAVETVGSRRIVVGKESAYEVTIRNSGPVAADQVVVNIALPEWADVMSAEASTGATSSSKASGPMREFRWKVGLLEAGGQQKLVLRIVPRQSQPLDLAITWDSTPVASQAVIEVQEPKLEMSLEGPREVLYGERQVYRLELENVGTGDAQDVKLTLMPIGGSGGAPTTQAIGTLPAGGKKVVELELTARQTGTLSIDVQATGEGGLHAQLAEKIAVHRAALAAVVEAPKLQFVGTQATYRVRVTNTGTAPARNTEVKAALPTGVDYASSTQGCRLGAGRREVIWSLASLAPGEASSFDLTCNLTKAGLGRLEVTSSADGDLTAQAAAEITVEAMADLHLAVTDPAGPVAVGGEALYQVDIQNRGTKNAEDVEVVAYFSEGIEPTGAEGGSYRIGAGQIVFEKIASVEAGEKISLKIKARAQTAGNHIFRAEVNCQPLGARLVSEETTHFYAINDGPEPIIGTTETHRPAADGSLSPSLVGDRYANRALPAGEASPLPPSSSTPR